MTLKAKSTYCKNCNSLVEDKYCSKCGQRSTIHKVTFGETFHDLVSSLFLEEGPLWQTLKFLVINPGKLFREYLVGRRKTYYKPVNFFVLITVVYLLIRALIDYDPFQNTTLQVSDNTQRQLLIGARNFMLLNIDKFLFVFVFSLGLMMKLFFYRNYSLAEYIAVSFYLIGLYTVMGTLNMFYVQYVNQKFQFLAILAMQCYFCYAMISFFQRRKLWVFFKSIATYFLATMAYGFSAFAISYLIVWLKQS